MTAAKTSKAFQPVMAVFLFVIWAVGYYIIASRTDPAAAATLESRVDQFIPIIPQFVFLYVAIYPIFLLPFFLVSDRELYKIISYSYLTLMLFCYSIFLIYPVSIARFPIADTTTFTAWALGLVHQYDKPVNCFPSMHCAMAMMSALTIYEISRFKGAIALVMTFLIGVSTLLIKQHYVLDVLAGFGLAAMMYYIYFKQKIVQNLSRGISRVEESLEAAIMERLDKRIEKILDQKLDEKFREYLEKNPE